MKPKKTRKTKFNLPKRIPWNQYGVRPIGISHLRSEYESRQDAKASGYDVKLRASKSHHTNNDRMVGQGEFGPYPLAFPREDNKGPDYEVDN